jgi:hypothetical protein
MLALEQRPVEPAARGIYLRLRGDALERIAAEFRRVRPRLPEADARVLATFALAGGDGIFLASLTGDADVTELFRLHTEAIVHLVTRAEAEAEASAPEPEPEPEPQPQPQPERQPPPD